MKTAFQLLHETTGDDAPITEAERILLDTHRQLRRAEESRAAYWALQNWNRLERVVFSTLDGNVPDLAEEEQEVVPLLVAWIRQQVEERR